MYQFGIRALCPTARSLIELVRKGAHGHRDRDPFRGEKGQLAFPIQASRGDRRLRHPVERDVVEDVVSAEALRVSVEDAGDERVTARVMVEHPGRQADG